MMSMAITGMPSGSAAQISGLESWKTWKFSRPSTPWTAKVWAHSSALPASISESQNSNSTPWRSASSLMPSETSFTNGT